MPLPQIKTLEKQQSIMGR